MTSAPVYLWDGASAGSLAAALGLPRVELLAEVDSTLDVAHALAERGAPAGTLVVADAQRAGRGRLGRGWRSEPGRGVWCTVLERPQDAAAIEVLSIRVGLAIAERLDAVAGERVGVKWPNDLVLSAGKLGGILAEARWTAAGGGTSPGWVAIGVGVNVLPPRGVAGAAGLPSGPARRMDVLAAVVAGVREAASRAGHLTDGELKRFHARDILSGRRVSSPANGVAEGITRSGALKIRTRSGEGGGLEEIRAGTVQFAEDV